MAYTATGYSQLQQKQVTKEFDDPIDAIEAAIEIMGEGDANAGAIGPDNQFYDKDRWQLLSPTLQP